MRYLNISVLLLVVLLGGCSIAKSSKLLAPERQSGTQGAWRAGNPPGVYGSWS